MERLIFQTFPRVTVATNQFVNVPVILQYDDTPLISVVKQQSLGYTTEIPIYHSDGTYLAKITGTRVYPTEDGKKAGIEMRALMGQTVCEMDGRTLFEIHHEAGDAFRTHAELFAPDGYFVKLSESPTPEVIRADGEALQIGSITMIGNTFVGCRIGVWVRSNGSVAIAVG